MVTDALLGDGAPADAIATILAFMRGVAADPGVCIDPEVATSEHDTGFRNASLANFLRASGNLEGAVADVLQVYFNQCALSMDVRQLARAGLFLANGGVDPLTGAKVTTPLRARRINAVMMTCGHYDASGEFAFRVGLPGKSGVGGGILAIAPGRGAHRRGLVARPQRRRDLAGGRAGPAASGGAHRMVGVLGRVEFRCARLTAPPSRSGRWRPEVDGGAPQASESPTTAR